MSAADAIEIGLATHHVASETIALIPQMLAEDDRPVDAVLREAGSALEHGSDLAANRRHIDNAFAGTSVAGIASRLVDDGSHWALEARAMLAKMSPQSLDLTLDLLLWGKQRSLRECLEAELRAAKTVIRTPDFIEGVRAALVDKDRSPRWSASLYEGTTRAGVLHWTSDRLSV
jgi:enoyl-CoA hydratase